MKNKTLFLPGFHCPTLRRQARFSGPHSLPKREPDAPAFRSPSFDELFLASSSLLNAFDSQFSKGLIQQAKVIQQIQYPLWAFFSQVLMLMEACQK